MNIEIITDDQPRNLILRNGNIIGYFTAPDVYLKVPGLDVHVCYGSFETAEDAIASLYDFFN